MKKYVFNILIAGFLLGGCSKISSIPAKPGKETRVPASEFFVNFDKINPKKKTVCAMTFNSTEEVELFHKYLPSKDFQFVELVKPHDEKWLDSACKKSVRCDILLVSGHFGGFFFGLKNKIDLEKLESASCKPGCDGIFKTAKEVYLFGCNTLSGKERDERTPQEYLRVLLEDQFSEDQAQLIVAFRYSPYGAAFSERMKKMFSNTPRIYGFSSVGPSGSNVEPYIDRYLKAKGANYSKYLDTIDSKKNIELRDSFHVTTFVQERGLDAKTVFNPVCYLEDKKIGMDEKFSWIEKALGTSERIEHAPLIRRFFMKLEDAKYQLNKFQNEVKTRINANIEARDHFLRVIKELKGFTFVQAELMSLSYMIGWLDSKQYEVKMKEVVVGDIEVPMTEDRKRLICSLKTKIDIKFSEIPTERWKDKQFLEALGCLQPKEAKIYQKLISIFKRAAPAPEVEVWYATVNTLKTIKTIEGDYIIALTEILTSHKEEDVRAEAAGVLGTYKTKNSKAIAGLVGALSKDKSSVVKSNAVQALGEIGKKDPMIINAIVEMIKRESDIEIRDSAIRALGAIKSNDKVTLQTLVNIVDREKDTGLQGAAVTALGEIGSNDEPIIAALKRLFDKSEEEDLKAVVDQTIKKLAKKSAKTPKKDNQN